MKLSAVVFITALTGVLATPAADRPESLPRLEARAPCYHASDCSWFYGAKCEQYCRQWGQNAYRVSARSSDSVG
ncbi:uncharacterized protein DNG_10270 [Cephalotrichum gorgonifer]|uniref:Uncharacterized protein n=1 Tax=Cephalotrichum gorgonifer TaxID=2041049 RepID=A0AAE8T047_9PEZI|nr:uncharacterized protein DNG_10270 [Cephalotrichum gorgonifer]